MMRAFHFSLGIALLLGQGIAAADGWAPAEGGDLVGTRAPAWSGIRWLQGGPLALDGLRGRVVLLRFWTDGCGFCTRSAPVLNELWARDRDRGLVVVGLHHPKQPASRDPEAVRAAARALGFEFPIGTDPGWETVRAYGVGTTFTRFTSVSFVIDAAGVIRHVHDGGDYSPAARRALEAAIERSLKTRDTTRSPR